MRWNTSDMNERRLNSACTGAGQSESGPGDSMPAPDGILLVDKPEGMLSFGLVSGIKRLLRVKKVGHCGTLDPFATGVMVICLNQATRIADQFLEQDKVYRFTLRLGVETDTLDRTGRITRTCAEEPPSRERFIEAMERFRGPCRQRVPRYAAVRVNGERLYKMARKGIDVAAPEREICIYRLELRSYRPPEADLEAHCSKGTYVRQLAADIGEALGCGAHVTRLRRLASGPFHVDRSVSLEDLEQAREEGKWREKLILPSDALSHLPVLTIEDGDVLKRLRHGNLAHDWEREHRAAFPDYRSAVRLVAPGNHLVALWWPRPETGDGRRLRLFG